MREIYHTIWNPGEKKRGGERTDKERRRKRKLETNKNKPQLFVVKWGLFIHAHVGYFFCFELA